MTASRSTLLLWSAFLIFFRGAPALADSISLAWDRNSEPDVAGYLVSYGTAPGSHTTTINVGNQTSTTLRNLVGGQRYYFVARAYNFFGVVSPPSDEVSAVALQLVGLISTASSDPIPTGTPVTWTALAGPGMTLEYQFYRLHQASGTWSIVQNYSPQNSFTWTPSPGDQGTYIIQVWARTPGSSEAYEAWRSTGAFAVSDSPVTVGSVEANVALPAPTGSPITWTARATGGPSPLEYRFYRLNWQTGSWTLARDYSTSNSFTWTPQAGDVGTHNVQVWVRHAGSTALDAWRNTDPFVINNGPPAVASLSASASLPAGTGTPITWRAVASGGPGPLQYKFLRWSTATNGWTIVQDFGPSDSYTWTPTSGQTGTYVIQVWVRRAGSTADFEGWAGTPQFQIVNSTPTIRGISSNGGSPVGPGRPITWTVDAVGGPGPLQYAFYLHNVDRDAWSLVRSYSSSNTFTWTPGAWNTGTYVLQVWVRRSNSTAALDTWYSTSQFNVMAASPTVSSITNNVGNAGTVGMPITWTANPAGGQGPLEFRFVRYSQSTQSWTVVQEYSWDNTFGWVPQGGEQGTYTFQVWVRRSGSTAAVEGWAATGPFVVH